MELRFELARPAYVVLFDVYEDGRAALLPPRPDEPAAPLAAGLHPMPDADAAWQRAGRALIACPLAGRSVTRERLKIIATRQPLASLRAALPTSPLTESDLSALLAELDGLARAHEPFADATVAYLVEAAPPGAPSACGGPASSLQER